MIAACIILAAAVLSFAQAPTKKTTPAQAKPDTWQKSKDCAAQTEKVMKDKTGFTNHYSPKYNRCFISELTRAPGERAGKDYPETVNQLIDAFEKDHSSPVGFEISQLRGAT